MGSALIQLCQDAAIELGLPVPNMIVRASDNTGRQFGGLVNRVGRLLLRLNDWTFLTRENHLTVPEPIQFPNAQLFVGSNTISGVPSAIATQLQPSTMIVSGYGIMTSVRLITVDRVAGIVTIDQPATFTGRSDLMFRTDTLPLPADYERPINRTYWDRSMRWELRGPQSPQSDQWVRSGIVATGPRRMYREINNALRIWPAPIPSDFGSQLIHEYISSYWVRDAGGAAKPRFTADQDTCVFEDDLMTMGLKYLFFQIKGFDTAGLERQWRLAVQNAIAVDGPSPTLDMDRTRFPIFISPSNVQDADFPGSFGNR